MLNQPNQAACYIFLLIFIEITHRLDGFDLKSFNQVESRASLVRVTLMTLEGVLTVLAIKASVVFAPLIIAGVAVTTAIAGIALIVDDLWVAFKGGNSVFLKLYNKAKTFFTSCKEWLAELPKSFMEWLKNELSSSIDFIQEKFTAFKDWLLSMAQSLKDKVLCLMPDFMQKGLLAP